MDAGDFSEGHIYYLADRGRTAYQVHGSVGFDVSVIGNHDYLMGAKDLDVILRDTDTDFKLIGKILYLTKICSYTRKIKALLGKRK